MLAVRLLSRAAIVALVLGFRSYGSAATIVAEKTFDELLSEADMIAVGRTTSVESHPTSDGRLAYTYVTLGELDVLKGSFAQPTIRLRLEGGPLPDGRVLFVPGMPEFFEGEKVAVFVRGNGRRICPLVGWWQGLLRVAVEAGTGAEIVTTAEGREIYDVADGRFVVDAVSPVTADPSSSARHEPDSHSASVPGSVARPAALTLGEFKHRVRARSSGAALDGLAGAPTPVQSATIVLDSPGPLPARPPRAR